MDNAIYSININLHHCVCKRIAVKMSFCLQVTVFLTERSHRASSYHCVKLIVVIIKMTITKARAIQTMITSQTTLHLEYKAVISEICVVQCTTRLSCVIMIILSITTITVMRITMQILPVLVIVVTQIVLIIAIFMCVMHRRWCLSHTHPLPITALLQRFMAVIDILHVKLVTVTTTYSVSKIV